MDTFYRDYRLTVGIGNQAVVIEPPITVSFKALETVDKKSLGKLSVSINGLKPSTRLQLLKSEDEEKYIPVRLEVGYNGKLRQVFQGSVKSGAVKREGAIHIVSPNVRMAVMTILIPSHRARCAVRIRLSIQFCRTCQTRKRRCYEAASAYQAKGTGWSLQ